MYVVVVDESSGHGDEGDVARKTAVVEPVDTDRRYAIYKASGIHGDDNEVRAGMKHCGNFAIKPRVAALVVANALLVDPDVRTVVGRANVEEGASAGFGLGVEFPLVPENTFVVEELGNLRVPIARHLQGWCGGKVVLFIVPANDVRVGVHGVRLVVDLAISGVQRPTRGLVDEVMPVASEAISVER